MPPWARLHHGAAPKLAIICCIRPCHPLSGVLCQDDYPCQLSIITCKWGAAKSRMWETVRAGCLRRGLVSVEARESLSRAWSAHVSPGATKPGRLSAAFSPFSTPSRSPRPHINEMDLRAFSRRLSGALGAPIECGSSSPVQAVLEQTNAREPVVGSDSVPQQGGNNGTRLC